MIWLLIVGLYLVSGLGFFLFGELGFDEKSSPREFLGALTVCLIFWPLIFPVGILSLVKKYLID